MPLKTIRVTLNQGAAFKTECTAGKHVVVIDQPAAMGGSDAGPTPLDVLLMALGGCLGAIGRIVAHQRRLAVRGFRVTVEGDLNTDGLMGKPTDCRTGFSAIRAQVEVDADLTRAEKIALIRDIDERCPISDNLQHVTPVKVSLADEA